MDNIEVQTSDRKPIMQCYTTMKKDTGNPSHAMVHANQYATAAPVKDLICQVRRGIQSCHGMQWLLEFISG